MIMEAAYPTQDEAYEQVKNLIYDTVWKFKRRYGGDFEELLSDANYHFIEAWNDYDPDYGTKLSTFVRNAIWFNLIDQLRRKATRDRHIMVSSVTIENQGYTQTRNDPIGDLADELTEDAKTVLELVLNSPAEISAAIWTKGGQPRNFRSCIRTYLQRLGWTAARVTESFDEIRQAIK